MSTQAGRLGIRVRASMYSFLIGCRPNVADGTSFCRCKCRSVVNTQPYLRITLKKTLGLAPELLASLLAVVNFPDVENFCPPPLSLEFRPPDF
jgi:hypothetical protein